jgi:hypothetical protein
MFRLFAALLFCGSLVIAVPAVSADEPAVVANDRECTPYGGGVTYCSTIKLVQHTADQPDGDQSFIYHSEMGEEMRDSTGILFSASIEEDIHFVTIEGLMQELHFRSRDSAFVPGFRCDFETFYHFANDQVQIDRNSGGCQPTL